MLNTSFAFKLLFPASVLKASKRGANVSNSWPVDSLRGCELTREIDEEPGLTFACASFGGFLCRDFAGFLG